MKYLVSIVTMHTSHAKIRQFGTCSYQNGLLVSWFAVWRKFLPKCQFGKTQTLVWRNPPPLLMICPAMQADMGADVCVEMCAVVCGRA